MKKNILIIVLAVALCAVGVRMAYDRNAAESGGDMAGDGSADALECIMTRYSLRAYSSRPVADSIVEKILRAGMAAPTAMRMQPWEMVVVTEQPLKDSIASVSKGMAMIKDAPLVVAVCGNTNRFIEVSRPPTADSGLRTVRQPPRTFCSPPTRLDWAVCGAACIPSTNAWST